MIPRRFRGSAAGPGGVPWPGRRRASIARRVTYAALFVWISLAAHLVLIYGTRPQDAPRPRSPLGAFELDPARAADDPFASWLTATVGSLLRPAAREEQRP